MGASRLTPRPRTLAPGGGRHRVAQLVHGLNLGGAQQVVKALATTPSARYSHSVYCSLDGIRRPEIESQGVKVRVVPRFLPWLDPFWALRLSRWLERDGIELVHAHLFGDSLHGYLAARLRRIPILITLHTSAPGLPRLQRRGYRWLLRRCDRVVACTDVAKRTFEALEPSGRCPIDTVSNGVAWERNAEPDRSMLDPIFDDGRLLLAIVGRLSPEKGHGLLFRALAELRAGCARPFSLLVVGDGPLRNELVALARSLAVEDVVHFLGQRDDARALLAAADIVVFSSYIEGLPMTLLEAMAARRCIVTTAAGGIPDAVRAEHEALLCAPGDQHALAEALRRALPDPALRDRLGAAAQVRFEERFTVERMREGYERIYGELLGDTQGLDRL
jgi:glycosyltransferase involved in cell wall biosynthesis